LLSALVNSRLLPTCPRTGNLLLLREVVRGLFELARVRLSLRRLSLASVIVVLASRD